MLSCIKLMAKVESTTIGDSLRNRGVLYGSMLSEKYAEDFLGGVDMCESSGATKLFGKGRITNENKPSKGSMVTLQKACTCGRMYLWM